MAVYILGRKDYALQEIGSTWGETKNRLAGELEVILNLLQRAIDECKESVQLTSLVTPELRDAADIIRLAIETLDGPAMQLIPPIPEILEPFSSVG